MHILGEDSEDLSLHLCAEHQMISERMANQAQLNLRIISQHLDKAIYDTPAFIEAVSQLARRSKYSQIQLLVHDSLPAVQNGHRLINLGQRLSSFIHIRKISWEYANFNEAFLIADERGIIHRQFFDRYDGIANFNAPLKAQEMTKQFIELWEQSLPDPQVRKLHI